MTRHAPVVLDIAGTTLTAADRRRLKHPLTGGLILFARHWVDRQQLIELCAASKRERPDLLICVDHEGGRVQRFRTDGFTHLPPMRVLGDLWMKDAMAATRASVRAMSASAWSMTPTPQVDPDARQESDTEGSGCAARCALKRAMTCGFPPAVFFVSPGSATRS